MDENVLEIENLSKKFCRKLKRSMWYGSMDITRAMLGMKNKDNGILRKEEFWALKGICFSLKKGDALGVIGPNGSGKTTLLRLITGIFPPNTGRIMIKGRVSSLIAVGAGFHPHMTGRENIYLNGAILGMGRKEIRGKIDGIIEFAEVGPFIDAPVATYSSGMRVRLGFAIAINVRPDVLIVDEVLAVGDQRFRRKARMEMDKLLNSGCTVLFVSHNLHEVTSITRKSIWMENGEIHMYDESSYVCSEYLKRNMPDISNEFEYMYKRTGQIEVTAATAVIDGEERGRLLEYDFYEAPQKIKLHVSIVCHDDIDELLHYVFGLKSVDGSHAGYVIVKEVFTVQKGEKKHLEFEINLPRLHIGDYTMAFEIGTEGGPILEGINNLLNIVVSGVKEYVDGGDLHFKKMLSCSRGATLLDIARV